jgi:hypothetical protein
VRCVTFWPYEFPPILGMIEDSTIFLADITPRESTGETVTSSINGPTASILAKKYQTLKRIPTFKRS